MRRELALGPDVVMRLIPHRRPFLMVDSIVALDSGARPTLWASRFISANEPVFDGHFPGLSVWPGVYTIEGMGQASNLLAVLHFLETGLTARGHALEPLFDGLRNIDQRAALRGAFRPDLAAELDRILAAALPSERSALGMSAAVDVKLKAPVLAGQRLDFVVTLTHVVERLLRFDVRAEVAGREVARGTMTGSFGYA